LNEPIIELDKVHLTLTSKAGPVHILRGVSLAIPAGQPAAIVGPSGSGKTSLLMVMAGLERASSGTVTIAGRELTRLSEDDLAVLRGAEMGIIFQSFHLVPTMTALENVALPMELAGETAAEEKARELLKEVGLAARTDHYPAELSGGEQQRVAIARALVREPRIIFADEPTGNLDGRTGRQIVDLLFGLGRRRNATLVIVTHDDHLAATADRIIRMADGAIASDESTKPAAVRAVSP
jgi:putative ABC transport system ATP-binding protein